MGTVAEDNYRKFEKLVEFLGGKISFLEGKIADAKTTAMQIHERLCKEPESAEGKIKTEFDLKEEIWKDRVDAVIAYFDNARSDLGQKKNKAVEERNYWEEQVQLEKERQRQMMEAARAAIKSVFD